MRLRDVGVVVIGRNEGRRLEACLASVVNSAAVVVYVDSGSTDDSLATARALGVEVVELATASGFTAARARNAGLERTLVLAPELHYLQFVDGDCEVVSGWLATAAEFLAANPNVAALFGRRRETRPRASVYNALCDLEWAVAPGPAKHFGGDVMLRTAPLVAVGGYRADLIAGEEPELSVRLRQRGWLIHSLASEMTRHDANITQFRQWWLRMKRAGYAYAAGAGLHGSPPERHWVAESRRAWLWSLGPLVLAAALAPFFGVRALGVIVVYPLQALRLFAKGTGSARERALRAVFYTLARFPEFSGQMRYVCERFGNRSATLIEYKQP